MEQRKKNASKLELGLGENLMSLSRIVLGVSYLEQAKFLGLAMYGSSGGDVNGMFECLSYFPTLVNEFAGSFLGATLIGPFMYAFGSDIKREGLYGALFR